ncbi:MAG: DUF4125 family protein [Clostridiales Family XIII bacterium]|jgi:hypothetical protein|nr:DUF4125 family protein [Clostridiales Family XIII bacterium]
MNELIDRIVAIEWKMFDKAENASGRAACQDDRDTFDIMRRSQFEAWNEALLRSYLADLNEALTQGRNLLTEKYAYIMEYTVPLEFQEIKDALPPVSYEKKIFINKITELCMMGYDEIADAYPRLAAQGRPQYRAQQTDDYPSAEAYMLGELSTLSLRTLRLYLDRLLRLSTARRNFSRMILENTMRKYGFASLAAAEARLREAGTASG